VHFYCEYFHIQGSDYENKEIVEFMLNMALSDTDGTYEILRRCDTAATSVQVYKIAPEEVNLSIKKEQKIYATPCKQKDYGPVYCRPSANEKKIAEEFEGKRFRKLFHKEIKLVHSCIGTSLTCINVIKICC